MNITLRRKKLQEGRKMSLYLDIIIKKKRRYEFLKLYLYYPESGAVRKNNKQVMELAERIRAKRLLELQHEAYGFVPEFKMRLSYIDYFENLVKKRAKTGKNYSTWKHTLTHLKHFTEDRLNFDQLDDGWLINFRTYLEDTVAANTAMAYFNIVKHSLYQAQRDKIIVDNPATRVSSPKKEETKREFLTAVEVQQMIDTSCKNKKLKRAFLFSCLTGLRWSDIQKLKWEEIRVVNDHLEIDFTQKKTKGVEYLPINEQAEELLPERGADHELVFGLSYSANNHHHIKRWALNAGITKNVSFHTARHTHAVMLLESGVEIYTVSRLLGHRDLKTTQIYANIVDESKRKAVNCLPKLELNGGKG
jgi:site-specific recombinase XerD